MKIRNLSSSNSVAGEGIIRWSMQDEHGDLVHIELLGYHIPTAEVRLLSPQVLLKTIGGQSKQTVHGIKVSLDNGIKLKAEFCPRSNLPVIPLAHEASSKKCFWAQAFGFSANNFQDLNKIRNVLHQSNTNLSQSQKELLLWHQWLSHASVKWIQALMRDRKWLPTNVNKNEPALHTGPFIRTKAGSRAHCCDSSTLHCAACLYAKASTRTPSNLAPRPSTKNNILKRDHLLPGDCVSADHYFSPIIGRLPHTYGREHNGYTCGSLFVDHASGKIFNFSQYSNTAAETIRSAIRLETMASDEGFKIKSYHSDNGIFASPDFKQHCSLQNQKYNFGAVGAKHQNGIAERNIKTVAQWARANMLHLATLWPQYAHAKYWPQAIDYAVWVFNRLPNMESGISPNEIWFSARGTSAVDLPRTHVFGCPVYVLDPALQDGKKIPKWDPCAHLGLFLGFLDLHSSQVPMVLNVTTGRISPQFHVIFDDKFDTVHSLPVDQPLTEQWNQILRLGHDSFTDLDYGEDGEPILPTLLDIARSYSEQRQ